MKYHISWTRNKDSSQKVIKKGNICITGAKDDSGSSSDLKLKGLRNTNFSRKL